MNYLAQKRIFTSQELLTSTDLNQASRLQNSAASLLQAIFPNVSEKYAA